MWSVVQFKWLLLHQFHLKQHCNISALNSDNHNFTKSSLHFNGHFPEPGLAGFTGTKDNGSGGDNWTCKAPVNFPTYKPTPNFFRRDVLPVAQQTVSTD